jgi:glycerol-3-phosphate O-acyltransferase / dihydroxyacetone phosphate acyltransferase
MLPALKRRAKFNAPLRGDLGADLYNFHMPEDVRVLRLIDMISSQKGRWTRRIIHALISIALRLFFRRIEVSGAERVPLSSVPLIFVLNHPNGLIDPALVFCAFPRRVSFLAASTLFRLPVIGSLLRVVEALPLYRRVDASHDATRNIQTFNACHELLRLGRCIALFPEGVSHDSTHLLPLKTGAARIALGAISVSQPAVDSPAKQEAIPLSIVPVGLYYTSKTSFRGEALLRFGVPLEVSPVALDEDGEPPRHEVQLLSKRIETALREVTLNTDTDAELEEVKRAEELFSSLYESIAFRQTLHETFNTLRRLAEGLRLIRAHAPDRVKRLRERIDRYERELRSIGITPDALSISAHSRGYVFRHFLLRSLLIALLSPLAVFGALVHFPAYLLSNLLAWRYRTRGPDSIAPTVKILAAIVLMPMTWLAVSALSFFWWGWRASVLTLPLVVLTGYVALRVFEELYEMRGWFKSVLVLLRRRGLFLRLLLERRTLHQEIRQLVADESGETGAR